MKFEIIAKDGNARAGSITTSHGTIQTPAFMPCGTRGAVKAVRWEELEELGYEMVLMNALHLYLRPGVEIIKSLGGVGKFSGWNGSVLTDSGGYQFFSLKGLYEIDDDGVNFRSPYDGSLHRFAPENVMELQIALGADIVMPLDECASGDAPANKVLQAGERTLAWLSRAKKYFDLNADGNRALFGIVQGGTDIDIRKKILEKSAELDLPGYAMGGISVGEDKEEGDRVVREITPLFPENKPRYLMGVGLPIQIADGIESGIDLFDCVLPTRMGRNGTVFTSEGRLNMSNARFKSDSLPLDPMCPCRTCARFSRAYLSHLHKTGDPGVLGLLSFHNLAYYRSLVRDARKAIIDGNFSQWRLKLSDNADTVERAEL